MSAPAALTVRPANEASWDDLALIFGTRGEPGSCQCQWFKLRDKDWKSVPKEEKAARLRSQTNCDHPEREDTTGIVAYLDGEPVGWCAVEPRSAYVRMRFARIPWAGRDEDRDDDSVWVASCFVVRREFRGQGISRALAAATVPYAREHGARAIEAYPLQPSAGQELTWGELYVGSRSIFADAGYTEITHPTPKRFVMRVDF